MSKKPSTTADTAEPAATSELAATTESAEAGGITYTGDGTQYIDGVPARDLTAAEAEALTDEQQVAMDASGLYDTGAEVAPRRTDTRAPDESTEAAPDEAAPAPVDEAAAEPPADEAAPEPTGGGA